MIVLILLIILFVEVAVLLALVIMIHQEDAIEYLQAELRLRNMSEQIQDLINKLKK